jgi:hypothetical protein
MRIKVGHFALHAGSAPLRAPLSFAGLQQAVQAAQDKHRQDDIAVLAANENIPEAVVSD